MTTECRCGATKCLSCLGTCPVCGDDISDHASRTVGESDRKKRLKKLLDQGDNGQE